ncbi:MULTISPECIES: MFS transporter [unclassified Fusibacter]|uniref:MFS transporter n=1 Tax=unclassified Fusibacter TaxID=2624464 RepID=UPI001012C6C6|nr:MULTISPECIES: MFS transporter [unclassified Fusibacter]MCK8061206.1 MFS transporter [Fusibacter sp. A2]NPE23450.1 MFS transporter [Fusibacter sp. A1]RXV59229.1 MFS transporter [Fusibacter sp. A1]
MKLTKLEKSWALYDWANSAYTMTVTTAVFPLYFKAAVADMGVTAAESTAYWGFANSFTSLLIALLAPILGTIADYYGYKKRFFMMFLATGLTACFILGLIPETQWPIMLIVYMITAIGFSGGNIFYDAFLVDVTTDERMDRVSTTGYALGYIGSTIPFILAMAIILLSQQGILPFGGYTTPKIAFAITAVWWLAFSLPMAKNVKQVYGIPRESHIIKNSFKRLGRTFINIKAYKPAFLFLLAYFFYIDGVDTIIKMATSYGSDLGVSSNNLLIILLATQFVAFPSALMFGRLADRFKGKTMLYVAITAYTGICIYAYFMKTTLDFWMLAMAVGLFQGGIQALSRSYFAKLIPKENANEFFGFYNIFGKFAAIMGPALIAVVTLITGKSNYGVVSLIILFIIGGAILTQVKPEKI